MCNIGIICRLCGTAEGIKFNIFDHKRTYVSRIHQLLPILVDERDPWSKLICHRCVYKLEEFNDFRVLCVNTDTYLKAQVSWKPPGISQHIPSEPSWQNAHIKHEQIEQEKTAEPSSTPPSLSPQIKRERQDMFSSEPPPLLPETTPAPRTEVQAHNLQHTSITQDPLSTPDPLSDLVFVNSAPSNSYLAEEPEVADSESTADDGDMGFPDSEVSEKMEVGANTHTPRNTSRKQKNKSSGVQVSKKRKMPKKHRSSSRYTNKSNGVKSVHASMMIDDGRKNGTKSNKSEPKQNVRTKAANINDNSLNLRSHGNADTLKKKLMHKPGPKSKVGSRDDDSESDESDVVFVYHKSPGSPMDVIDMTVGSDSPEEEVGGSDPEEGLLPNAVLTRIPGICNIYTCSSCEGTYTSKRRINNHVCKSEEFDSESSAEQVSRIKSSEDNPSGKQAWKNTISEGMASENSASVKKASYNSVYDNEVDSSRGNTSTSTLSSSFGPLYGLPRTSYLRQGAATVGEVHRNQDVVSPNSGSYKCDICGLTFSRQVTLTSHKTSHLYRMNDDDEEEEEDDDDGYRCVRKKKKPVAETVTENF